MKHKCKCGKLATWGYMPSEGLYRCDNCVPRGCTCISEDEPCVEWIYDSDGFDYEPEISLCEHCYCMTYTINDKCGKCKGDK